LSGPEPLGRFCTRGVGMTKNRTAVCRELDWSSVFTDIILALTFLYLSKLRQIQTLNCEASCQFSFLYRKAVAKAK